MNMKDLDPVIQVPSPFPLPLEGGGDFDGELSRTD